MVRTSRRRLKLKVRQAGSGSGCCCCLCEVGEGREGNVPGELVCDLSFLEDLQSAMTMREEFSREPNCSGEDMVTTDMVVG